MKSELGRGFSGLAGVRATTRARVTTMLAAVTTMLAGVTTTLAGVTMMLALLLAMPSAALAQGTEQSETITTTCESQTFGLTVEGTHFTINNGSNVANLHGIEAHVTKGGITVTAKNSERITKVVITCEYHPEEVTDNNIRVSSGTMTISDGGKTITVKNVNATTFNLNSSEFTPFSQFVVYYLTYKVTLKKDTKDADKWKAKAGEGELKALPLEGVAEGEKVTLQYEGRKRVMSVRATKKVAAWDGDLSKLTGSEPEGYATATDGMTITGKLADGVNVKVTIADRATVTLSDATILGTHVADAAYYHAGITCLGDATIVLVGKNEVKGFFSNYPGIHVPEDKTLTIQGEGSLDAKSNGQGCGIGGGWGINCGNITIEGGSITATGGKWAAGIGSGQAKSCGNILIKGGSITATGGEGAAGIGSGSNHGTCVNISITGGKVEAKGSGGAAGIGSGEEASCGDIRITGGTVEATGGELAAGIGSGYCGIYLASCGTVTITNTVTKVKATKGNLAPCSIGKGYGDGASCDGVTVGCTLGTDGKPVEGSGMVYDDGIATSPYTYWGVVVPLTMEALTDGTIKVVVDEGKLKNKVPTKGMQYAVNDGDKEDIYTTTEFDVKKGYRVTFYGNGTYTDCYYGTKISGGDAEVMVYGNIMSLVDETGFASANALSQDYAFDNLFYKNTTLKDASGLLLPATELAEDCYHSMFRDCSALTAGPAELPATELAEWCYSAMFYGCSALTTAPELPAKTLAKDCYNNMFNGCSRLTAAPRLPAEKLVERCYWMMFYNCTNLASVTCLATSGFDATNCLYDWLYGAGSDAATTPTLYVDKSMKDASWNNGAFTVTPIGE